jgi:SulP family sulfate permease
VVGGFLAGTGWLSGKWSDEDDERHPAQPGQSRALHPARRPDPLAARTAFGILLFLIARRYKHYLVTPLMILGAVAAFYLVLWLTGTSLSEATQLGLLFEPFPPGMLWQPPPLSQLAVVDWGTIFRQTAEIASLILISSITLLLYASGVELSAGREVDLNRELRACGAVPWRGVYCQPAWLCYHHYVSFNSRLGATSRLVGLLCGFAPGCCSLLDR